MRTFSRSVTGDLSIYQGPPTPKTEDAWNKLLNAGIVTLNQNEASRLLNETTPYREKPGTFLAAIEVFHQLHCLNTIRRSHYGTLPSLPLTPSHPDRASADAALARHVDHCIDALRQMIMCHGDTTMLPYDWDEEEKDYTIRFDALKRCRKFDQIWEWADARRAGDMVP